MTSVAAIDHNDQPGPDLTWSPTAATRLAAAHSRLSGRKRTTDDGRLGAVLIWLTHRSLSLKTGPKY
jgi:hypothetical protein